MKKLRLVCLLIVLALVAALALGACTKHAEPSADTPVVEPSGEGDKPQEGTGAEDAGEGGAQEDPPTTDPDPTPVDPTPTDPTDPDPTDPPAPVRIRVTLDLAFGTYEGEILSSSSLANPVFDGQGKWSQTNGDVYEGGWALGKRNGTGTQTYAGGDSYEGAWADDVKEGHGVYTWANGDVYVGNFAHDLPDGEGVKIFEAEVGMDMYSGHFAGGVFEGEGVYTWSNRNSLACTWAAGAPADGEGVYVWSAGDVFEGTIADGLPRQGVLTYVDGDVFEGTIDYAEGTRARTVTAAEGHKSGDYLYSDHSARYVGQMEGRVREGTGKLYLANDEGTAIDVLLYDGQWVAGVRCGTGTQIYADGTYVGQFAADRREGDGVMTYTSGDVFEGTFAADEMTAGRYRYAAGDLVYEGAMHDGVRHGTGKLYAYNADSEAFDVLLGDGEWLSDVLWNGTGIRDYADGRYEGAFAAGKRHGNGRLLYADGDIYEGAWAEDKRSGSGKLYYADGSVFEGTYAADASTTGVYLYTAEGVAYRYAGGYVADAPEGEGSLYRYDADTQAYDDLLYEGEWAEGVRHGTGTQYNDDGTVYVGGFAADVYDGEGKLSTGVEGDDDYFLHYDGQWHEGVRSGSGTQFYANGERYEGEWADDTFNGTGTYYYLGGTTYAGEWVDGVREGMGRYDWPNGDFYAGSWEQGVAVEGNYNYTVDDVLYQYVGGLQNFAKEGEGQLLRRDPATLLFSKIYEGQWSGDMREGEGTGYYADGTYVGSWAADRREGEGTYYYKEGTLYDGKAVSTYEGEWADDCMDGAGTITFADGTTKSGMWSAGTFVA